MNKEAIRQLGIDLGFDAVAFTAATIESDYGEKLERFLQNNFHGEMAWLAQRSHERSQPQNLWQDAKSVIVVAINYCPSENPLNHLANKKLGLVSAYAKGRDYHDYMKKKLRVLARTVATALSCEVKIFVDTAPILEKPLAQAAGIGWQGKHSNIVSRQFGSWLLLGEIFVAAEIPPDATGTDHCGTCSRCIDICPTQAIIAPYQLDARRCISYLTIEHKGVIPIEFRRPMANRIYGCDDCLAVCPWNRFAQRSKHDEFNPDSSPTHLAQFLDLDDAQFRIKFSGSPIKRIGRDRFLRNVLIAIGNCGDRQFAAAIKLRLSDDSPLVRGMAVWALRQLLTTLEFTRLYEQFQDFETDPLVINEWQLVC